MVEQTLQVAEETPVRAEKSEPAKTTRDTSRYLIPAVDIYETENGLVVVGDLPGVTAETLDIRVDSNILSIEGRIAPVESKGDRLYTEFGLATFFRQFELPEEVDQEKISAELRHGVLTLHLPKAEKAKPRQIKVHVG